MQDFIVLTGIILKVAPVGEFDRRICLLTKERGKVSAFVRGSRKPTARLAAATAPFSFGVFKMHQGRDSYSVAEADIQNYFEELRSDFEGACLGQYFCEIADYYCRENNDEREMLKLLYQSLRALCSEAFPNRLVRSIYELKCLGLQGEYPGAPSNRQLNESTLYTLDYIYNTSVEKLYSFKLTEEVQQELNSVAEEYFNRYTDRKFKSLEILMTL